MGINAETYKKSHFYEDIRQIFRFKEPPYTHQDLLGSKPGRESPFARIEFLLESLQNVEDPHRHEMKNEVIDLIKYFACCYVSNFRKKIRKQCKALKDYQFQADVSEEAFKEIFTGLDPFFRKYFYLLRLFSFLRDKYSLAEDLREHLVLEMLLAEEYCFYRFREGIALAVETLRSVSASKMEDYELAVKKLRIWSRFITWFEFKHHFLSVNEKSSSQERETFLSRLGNIKKYLSRVLYLDIKPDVFFSIRMQTGYMIAAALAAFWYFLANVMIFYYLQYGGFGSLGGVKNYLGLGGIAVIVAFVVAYVLKDRIKEISRVRFKKGLFGNLPDYFYNIYYTNNMKHKFFVGDMNESVKFVRKKEDIPNEIYKIREQGDLWDEEDQFDILFYRKSVELDPFAIQQVRPHFVSVKHIIRFSIRRFLTRLDDPIQIYLSLNKKGSVQEIGMPKVYYIGVALKFTSHERVDSSGFNYHVLVVDKNGLVRIDELARSVLVKEKKK